MTKEISDFLSTSLLIVKKVIFIIKYNTYITFEMQNV